MPVIRFGLALTGLMLLVSIPLPAQERERTDSHDDPLPPGAVARLGSVRWQHPGEIAALAFSPDGKVLASGGSEGLVCMWDVSSGRKLRSLRHGRRVDALAFSADGRRLASSGDSEIAVWDPGKGNLLDRWPNSFGDLFDSWSNPFRPQVLVFLQEPDRLLSIGDCVGCWDLATGRPVTLFPDQREAPQRFNHLKGCVSRDGRLLATCSQATTDLWDLQAGKRLWRQDMGAVGVAFSPHDRGLVTLGSTGTLRRRNLKTGEEEVRLPEMKLFADEGLLASSPDGALMVSSLHERHSDGSEHRLIDAVRFCQLPFPDDRGLGSGPRVFSPDGKVLAGGGRNGRIRLWDMPSGKLRGPEDVPIGLPDCVRPSVSFTRNGKVVAFVDSAGVLTLAAKDTLKPLRRWTAEKGAFSAVALSADGRVVATACQKTARDGGPSCFWDPATGHKLWNLPGNESPAQLVWPVGEWVVPSFLAVSPDGKLAACSLSAGQVCLVETASGKTVWQWQAEVGYPSTGCFSPDGKLFLAGDESGRLRVWDTTTGKETRSWLAHGGFVVSGFSFSADGKQLATTGGDGFVAVWEVSSWKRLAWLDRHNSDWATVALSPDGQRVAARGQDRSLLIWEVRTGRLRWRLSAEQVRLSDAVFDASSRWLLTAGYNDTLLKWDLEQLKEEPRAEPPALPAEGHQPLPPAPGPALGGSPSFQRTTEGSMLCLLMGASWR